MALIIGCGNIDRGDDAAGILVAQGTQLSPVVRRAVQQVAARIASAMR
jgi:Ni,Fe-hydrogenase maturation factor